MVYCYGDLVPPPGPPPGPALLSRQAPALTLQAAQLAVLAAGILAMYDAGANHKTVSPTNEKQNQQPIRKIYVQLIITKVELCYCFIAEVPEE